MFAALPLQVARLFPGIEPVPLGHMGVGQLYHWAIFHIFENLKSIIISFTHVLGVANAIIMLRNIR